MKNNFFYIILICVISLGCSQGEEKIEEFPQKNLVGTILGPISCNKSAYEVKIDNPPNIANESIGIINLPKGLQQNGLKINFDIVEYEDEELVCVTLRPQQFYEIFNATSIN